MQTTNPGLLFQTSQQLTDASDREHKLEATQNIGSPIKLSSKILDLIISDDDAWTAESGWQARCVDLSSGKTKRLFKGHKGPVTSVCLHTVKATDGAPWPVLLTASWDKTVRVWDAKIIKDHTRPVETAAFRVPEELASPLTVWTADSMGVIKEWTIPQIVVGLQAPLTFVSNLPGHETSVAQLAAVDDGLWSASMDYNAMFHGVPSATLAHPRYVKAILPHPNGMPYILTGSEDEHIRVWDSSNLERTNKMPMSVVVAHCGEVTAFGLWTCKQEGRLLEVKVVSASLDGTLRRWSMKELLNPPELDLKPPTTETMMTEEEERELAELMSDED
ncbi:hypothetical protein CcaverHIS002_0209580 [Cutaneotrichosporon cavernicola]|uniref:WD40 repeat-like protein n=1 Tax=Cutaneotrichosporon cavernicola TaxID=279322 RepID=A0AA48IIN4_9TREE|nr:uncharacterized protein CcaverHIS019_0209600 [Cutaneotrichosporon cavernicola]BEI81798.1 hypothetical protein CcaverHIS002_0209580 [Cutaneotrichosporon cavernicola]BEI89598.1 hypothetical protein CcaverHIS019_0209600 [Cutaneotrichosporon cavernicola]BEI97370.1 hypothetical protein CcaverHIS631_0209590 [Cutaneotrichosporon cavernicola]BEJ05147.1 hypothetical protein CcaverHIS641_0209640 [Cutaneotrichosporon cavernicola]